MYIYLYFLQVVSESRMTMSRRQEDIIKVDQGERIVKIGGGSNYFRILSNGMKTPNPTHKFVYFSSNIFNKWIRDSSVSIVSDYGLDDRVIGVRSLIGAKNLPLAFVYRLAPGPTQPAVQWVLGVLFPGLKRGRWVTLTTHSHLVPKSRMRRSCTSSSSKRLHGE
jgi:hypothetical protein